MKLVKRLLITAIAALPVVAMATSVSAFAWGGGSFWGMYQPECPKD